MRFARLAGFLLLTFSAAAAGSASPPGAWYDALVKPSWHPPAWLFGPVWTVLYICIGVAGWLAWESVPAEKRRRVMTPFFVQLALNAMWSPVFFMLHAPGWALCVIVAMLTAIVWTIRVFREVHRVAAGLLVPYACWVGFATVLNATLWHLN